MENSVFDPFIDTRPYNESEMPAAIRRVAADPMFDSMVRYLFPYVDIQDFRRQFLTIKTTEQFQEQVMHPAIRSVLKQTSSGLVVEGFGKLDPSKRYMFISNHRDILLDAAILQVALSESGNPTSEITFGSNLMQGQLVIDIGKMNKMFRIVRGGSMHDFYRNSLQVSSYMRYALLKKRQSTWIAQRNGRTKNGFDKTEAALLKMFAMSSEKPFVENLCEMNLLPVCISYEYEPCDFLKTQECYISQYQPYVKEQGEDLHSILTGVMQFKGNISLNATSVITQAELEECDRLVKNEKFTALAAIIDRRINGHYRLWKTNYIAYDLLQGTSQMDRYYSASEKEEFVDRMRNGLSGLQGDSDELQDIFLRIYANPLLNK